MANITLGSAGLTLAGALAFVLGSPAAMAASPQRDLTGVTYRAGIDLVDAFTDTDVAGPPTAARAESPGGGGAGQPAAGVETLAGGLEHALDDYRSTWGNLPTIAVPAGPALAPGQHGARIALLRERLGLEAGDGYDGALAEAVRRYRHVHGLGDGTTADAATIASLNRGPAYYEALIRLNLERLRALPADDSGRFILVDAAAQRLWLYEDGAPVDAMKVVVGKTASPTPMFATLIYAAEVNPYWNVPPDLVQKLVAPRVVKEGISYLARSGYDVLSDWSETAQMVDPATVDWRAVAAGSANVRVRQQPGPGNAMGALKLFMPNRFGVYLHDTPDKQLFAGDDRRRSNGCIRLEDAARLARWLFGEMPSAPDAGTLVPLAKPVPVYVTYLTAASDPVEGLVFRADRYDRDQAALAELDQPDVNHQEVIQTASR